MSINLSFFLIVYIILASIAGFLILVNLYHVFRFGHADKQSYFMTGIFVAGLIIILFVSFTAIIEIDWSTPIILFPTNTASTAPTSIPGTQF